MNPLANVNISTKVSVAPSILLFILMVIGGFSWWSTQQVSDNITTIKDKQAPLAELTTQLLKTAQASQSRVLQFERSRDAIELGLFDLRSRQFEWLEDEIKQYPLTAQENKLFVDLSQAFSNFTALVKDRIVPKLDERDSVIQQMNQQIIPNMTLLLTNIRYSLDTSTKVDDAIEAGMHWQKAGIFLTRFIDDHQSIDLERTRLEIAATQNALIELLANVSEGRVYEWAKKALEHATLLNQKLDQLNTIIATVDVLLQTTLRVAVYQVVDTSQRLQEEVWHNITIGTNHSQESIDRMSMITQLLTLLGLFIGVMVTYFIGKIITRPIERLGTMMNEVALTGQFHHRSDIVCQDEIGKTAQAMNQLLSSLEQAISETNQVISSIAGGDLSKRIRNNYVGDLDKLKQGVNVSADNISEVMDTLSNALASLKQGQFECAAHSHASGQYGVMLANVADTVQDLSRIVHDMNNIMDEMNAGNFTAKVTVMAHGDFDLMKNNVNTAMSNIASIISSIVKVVEAQAEGDWTKELPSGTYRGQFHNLKNAINFSAQKVKDSVNRATDASNIVHDAASQVSQGATDLSGRVQEQAAALEQTSATMNEMAVAVQANTANAHKVSELAHQVRHQTTAGVEVMQKTISAMQSIKASSSQIADIVTLIDGIAFQTNLLALNAAVEAARAGEHGRGFAVVAGEVRALAQKSASAAKDIKDLITESVHRIEVGTQLADKSGEMLNGITDSIGQVASMVEQIASASSEQSDGIHQVHRAIANIDKVTQENAALVEETTSSAESLSVEAHNLKENMSFFKTGRHY